jgi:hypothetical protein
MIKFACFLLVLSMSAQAVCLKNSSYSDFYSGLYGDDGEIEPTVLSGSVPQDLIDLNISNPLERSDFQEMNAKMLVNIYSNLNADVFVTKLDKFKAHIFTYENENGEPMLGYRDQKMQENHGKKEKRKPDYYKFENYLISDIASSEGENFVELEDFLNLMEFNLRAVNYNPITGGEFRLS